MDLSQRGAGIEEHTAAGYVNGYAEEVAAEHGYELPTVGTLNEEWAARYICDIFNISPNTRLGKEVLDCAACLVSLRGLAYGGGSPACTVLMN